MRIQRYDWTNRIGEAIPSAEGQYVLYADHVAAVAEAEQRVTQLWQQKAQAMEERGVQRGLTMARDAVDNWPDAANAIDQLITKNSGENYE